MQIKVDSEIGTNNEVVTVECTNLVPPPFINPPKNFDQLGGVEEPSLTRDLPIPTKEMSQDKKPKKVSQLKGSHKEPEPIKEEDIGQIKKEVALVKKYNKELSIFRKQKIEQAEHKVLKKLPSIIDKVIEQALKGDLQASKLLLDRVIPVKKALDEGGVQVSKGGVINITVNAANENSPKTLLINNPVDSAEDAEYEELEQE